MVGERLAEIRKDHDDTQAALAKKTQRLSDYRSQLGAGEKFPLSRRTGGHLPFVPHLSGLSAGAFRGRPCL